MIEKLKADWDEILDLVKKAPGPLQEIAFKLLLERWFSENAAPRSPLPPAANGGSTSSPPPAAGVPDGLKPFLTANGITTEVLEKVFHPTGPGAQLLAGTMPGNGKANQLISLSLLLCIRRALESGTFTCTLKELREMAVHYDCYDSPNFSTTLKSNKNYFKPREKGGDLELSGPGLKRAGELIKSVATGT